MTENRVGFRYLILGLIAERPMSGYDIMRFLENLNWLIGAPSCGSLYPALRRLLQDGLATVEVVAQGNRPPKKLYHISDEGRRLLREWTEQPSAPGTPRAFAMRLVAANSRSPAELVAELERRKSELAGPLARLGHSLGGPEGDDSGTALALRYARTVAAAEVGWLNDALTRLRGSTPQPLDSATRLQG